MGAAAAQREQMFGVLDTAFLQASASSLVSGYRNVRAAVGLPDGGVLNPPTLQYQPIAVLQRPLPARAPSAAGAPGGGVVWAGAPSSGLGLGSGLGPRLGPGPSAAPGTGLAGGPASGPIPSPASAAANTALAASLVVAAASLGAGPRGLAAVRGLGLGSWAGPALPPGGWRAAAALPVGITRPPDNESLAFMPVLELAALLRARAVTSRELTALFLERLRRYDGVLEYVVTYTDALATQQAGASSGF